MKSFADVAPDLQPILAAGQPWRADVPMPYPDWSDAPEVETLRLGIPRGKGGVIPCKTYRPRALSGQTLPAVLWLHGGGYVAGDIEADDPLCERIALQAGCVVLAPDYRLAPQHPYPAGLEDGYTALCWLAENTTALGVNPAKIAVAGASAGGGMTAALALLARERGGPALCFQMPLYPMLDDRCNTPSSYEITEEAFPNAWNRTNNLYAWDCYLKDLRAAGDTTPLYAAPGRATVEQLRGLPPAYLCIGTLDSFRDEVIAYVAKLCQADVPVQFHLYPGGFHGFDSIYNDAPTANACRDEYIAALAAALA